MHSHLHWHEEMIQFLPILAHCGSCIVGCLFLGIVALHKNRYPPGRVNERVVG